MPEAALRVSGLVVEYHRGMPVVNAADLQVDAGEIVGFFGRNGAGKSTTLRAIFGLVPRLAGEVFLFGKMVRTSMRAHKIVRLGATMVVEGRGIFADLTVEENLRAAARRADYPSMARRMFEQFPLLASRRKTAAGRLSGGEQQLLAIARAGMLQPRLLVVDEPSLGLSPAATQLVVKALRALAQQGSSVLIADQNVTAVGPVCDRAVVMEGGTIVLHLQHGELIANPERVEDIYLGKE